VVRCGRHERFGAARVAALALALIALFVSGCGNARRDFRVDDLNPRTERVDEERAELAALLRVARPRNDNDARALRGGLADLRAAMHQVAALNPPDSVDLRFRRYVRANAALLASLSRFVDAFANDGQKAQAAAGEVQTALGRASRAQTDLQRALK
jgi:hypothetical protein